MKPDKTLCLNFCSYYKPGSKEELACRGYQVAERLMREGREIRFERLSSGPDPADSKPLIEKLCPACDFREDGCDFIVDRKSAPCGGFLLLSQLLSQGLITDDDI